MIIRREVIQYYHSICNTNCGVKGDTLQKYKEQRN